MNKITYILILALLLLSLVNAEIITTTSSTNTYSTPELDYNQYSLNLTDLQVETQLQIVNCLMLLSTGNFIDQNTSISDAFLRKYTDGAKQYYLSFEKNDTTLNTLQQSQAIIRLNISESSALYVLVDFLTLETDADGNDRLVSYATYIVSPLANTLTEVATKLSTGLTLLSSDQTANDQIFKTIDSNFRKIYDLSGASVSYVAASASSGVQQAFKGYRVFYSSDAGTSSFKFKIGSAVYNSEAKAYYIHNLLEVQLPRYITLN